MKKVENGKVFRLYISFRENDIKEMVTPEVLEQVAKDLGEGFTIEQIENHAMDNIFPSFDEKLMEIIEEVTMEVDLIQDNDVSDVWYGKVYTYMYDLANNISEDVLNNLKKEIETELINLEEIHITINNKYYNELFTKLIEENGDKIIEVYREEIRSRVVNKNFISINLILYLDEEGNFGTYTIDKNSSQPTQLETINLVKEFIFGTVDYYWDRLGNTDEEAEWTIEEIFDVEFDFNENDLIEVVNEVYPI